MAYVAPTTRSDGYVVPASVWNSDVVNNPIALAEAVSMLCNGRLTLTSGTPVTTADVTAATTLYFTPYKGSIVGVYTGSAWIPHTLTELSIAVPATTATVYDVFLDYNAGTPVLAVTAWSSATARATALTTQDGVLVQTGNLDWRFLGIFRTTAVSGQAEDSKTYRGVWNHNHRVPRLLEKLITTDTYTYTTNTIRQWEGSTANQVAIVVGVAEDAFALEALHTSSNTSADVSRRIGIGEGSTTAMMTTLRTGGASILAATASQVHQARFVKIPAIGYQYYAGLEVSAATGTTTWYGDDGATSGPQSGLMGWILG